MSVRDMYSPSVAEAKESLIQIAAMFPDCNVVYQESSFLLTGRVVINDEWFIFIPCDEPQFIGVNNGIRDYSTYSSSIIETAAFLLGKICAN